MVEPVYEKLNYCQKIGQIKEQISLSAKSSVSCQEIDSVLSVAPFTVIDSVETVQGKIKYSGRINFFICYLDKQNAIKKCECASEFNGQISNDLIEEDAKVSLTSIIEKSSVELNGALLTANAIVSLDASLTKQFEQNAVSGGQNLFVQESEIEIEKGLGIRLGACVLEEKFELSYSVEEVMFHQANAVISSVQSGVGCIIVEGQVLLSLVLLQKTEKKDIIKVCKTLPFRTEIECEECMPNLKSVAFIREKPVKTDIEVDENTNTSVVSVSVSLNLEGQTYLNQTLMVAEDLFCTTHHLDIERKTIEDYCVKQISSTSFMLNGRCGVGELAPSTNVLATAQESVMILSHAVQGDKLTVNGVCTAIAYLIDGDGLVFSRRLELPFEKTVDNIDGNNEFIFTAKAFRTSAKIISLTEIELDGEIFLTVYLAQTNKIRFISQIIEGQEKEQKKSAISVYISQGGEQLFSLAKSLNVCPEELARTNEDLNFPLDGNERIVIYRQLQ